MYPDDCSECQCCGGPMLGWGGGYCDTCISHAYARYKLDANGFDEKGRNLANLAIGQMTRAGNQARHMAQRLRDNPDDIKALKWFGG